MTIARYAYGQARVRARKSFLPAAADAAARPAPADRAARFAALLSDYALVLGAFPGGGGLARALLGLHEIENLKLLWRALDRRAPAERWAHLWRPLGSLATLRLEDGRDAVSLPDVLRTLGPPLAKMARAIHAAHAARPADAEVALDRWASRRLLDEARALPPRESVARDLALAVVRERDLDLVRRARSYGMTGEAAAGAAVLLPDEIGPAPLRALAAWTPADGPLFASLPPALARRAGGRPAGWDELTTLLRRARRAQCARAFRQAPFHLGCAVAYLLLREEEERSWTALCEEAPPQASAVVERVLAAGPMAAA
ncbi:MAG TPA: V-type ATPase subunit [Vicinamibacteria bacterium]